MGHPYQHIEVERQEDVFRVRSRRPHMENLDILLFGEELTSLVEKQGCRRLSLSVRGLDVMSSLLVNKLLAVRRLLLQRGGMLELCHASEDLVKVFEGCGLGEYFTFVMEEPAFPPAPTDLDT